MRPTGGRAGCISASMVKSRDDGYSAAVIVLGLHSGGLLHGYVLGGAFDEHVLALENTLDVTASLENDLRVLVEE